MNAISCLSAQPWVERLGWTLLHFVWQGILIAAVYAAARRFAVGPSACYLLACAALAAMAAAPVVTWAWLHTPAAEAVAASFQGPASAAALSPVRTASTALPLVVHRDFPAPVLPWVVAVWLAGAMAFWLRLLGGWMLAERLRSRLVRPASQEWQQVLDRLRLRVRVFRPVRMLVSGLVDAPAVVGWLRPVVLLPVGALAGLPAEQIEALLLHELAHIRRHDYLVNILQNALEAVLFYHPAVWWISSHIRAERELCCDDRVVSMTGDAAAYARALAGLGSASMIDLRPAVAATGGSLAHRIARLLGHSHTEPRAVLGPRIAAAGVLLAVAVFAVFAQTGTRPEFEVASVKPSQESRFMKVSALPGRFNADASLKVLMQNAYAVQPFQIVGGPEWVTSERYAIDAKAANGVGRAQVLLMLQSLLEERFQLKLHRETRQLPVYELVAARSGLKLPSPKEGSCVDTAPDAPPVWGGGRMQTPGQGSSPLTRCGDVRTTLETGGARMQGGKVPMAEFVRLLSLALDRTVLNRTGFSGPFDLALEFLPDESTPAMPPPPPDALPSIDLRHPPILTALSEQLGLRLEATKGPVEVMVIDRVEQPSGN